MDKLYLFEAGGTKTSLVYRKEGKKTEVQLPAFNPNRSADSFIEALKSSVHIEEDANVYFYGSGLSLDVNRQLVESFFDRESIKKLNIYDDILGAARAAFKNNPGIICIMGTGGLAAYYDGKQIVKRRGGYGYLIDDLGGGFELGRRIISAWLKGDLDRETEQLIEQDLELSKDAVTYEIYHQGRVQIISEVARTLSPDMPDENLQKIIKQYFVDFMYENVQPLSREYQMENISVVGGLGTAFYRTVREVAKSNKLVLEQCIQNPVQRLFDFHSDY